MRYKNVKTGVEIDVLSECGGDWEPVEEPKKKNSRKRSKTNSTQEVPDTDLKESEE